jgi:hypothetical protein
MMKIGQAFVPDRDKAQGRIGLPLTVQERRNDPSGNRSEISGFAGAIFRSPSKRRAQGPAALQRKSLNHA